MKLFIKFLFLASIFLTSVFANPKSLDITYISHHSKEQKFGKNVYSFANAVSKDLGINLNIVYPTVDLNRYKYLEFLEKVIKLKPKPDFVIAVFFRKTSEQILKLSEKYNIPIFIVNTSIPVDDKELVGEPREKYKNFLATLTSNEFQAGYDLAKYLIKKAKKNNTKKNINIVGLSGPRETTEAIERNNGLIKAINEDDRVNLHQILYANWDKTKAYILTKRVLDRYDEVDIIWTASDGMAIGAKKAIIEKEIKNSIFVGGIDWTNIGVDSVENGYLDVTVGGHFMNGGFALILLYDYFYGIDFKDSLGTKIQLDMSLLTKENVNRYLEKYSSNEWQKIDFKKFSKVLNPELKKYDFSLENIYENFKVN